MMRLIDADALNKRVRNEGEKAASHLWGAYTNVVFLIEDAPTVIHLCEVCKHMHNTWDSETCDGCTGRECNFNPIDPVRHGEWKATEDPWFRACSVCGYLEYECNGGNYCPECGAKMDEGADDEHNGR